MTDHDLSKITFRPATLEDREAILRASRGTYAEHKDRQPAFFPHARDDPQASDHIAQAFVGVKRSYQLANLIVAEGPEGMAGFVLVASTSGPMQPGWDALLSDIWVAPDWRRKGLGAALVDQAVDFARSNDARQMDAMVWQGNNASHALFAKAPFDPAHMIYRVLVSDPKPQRPRNTLLRLWDSLSFVLVIVLVSMVAGLAVVGALALLGRF